jgi:hypothetical protein
MEMADTKVILQNLKEEERIYKENESVRIQE